MTLIDLNFIQFYQSPIKSNLSRKKTFKTFIVRNFTISERENSSEIFESKNEWNTSWSDNFIQFPNIVDSLFKKHLDFLREKASNFKEIEANLKCKMFNNSLTQLLTILNISNIFCDISVFNHDIIENNNNFSFLKKLFFDDENIAMYKKVNFNNDVEKKRLQNKIQNDDDQIADLEFEHNKNTDKYMNLMYQWKQHQQFTDALLMLNDDYSQKNNIDSAEQKTNNINVIQFSDNLILKKKNESQNSFNISSMSVTRSKTKWDSKFSYDIINNNWLFIQMLNLLRQKKKSYHENIFMW